MKGKIYFASVLVLASLLTGCITVFVPVDTPTPGPTAILLATLAPSPQSSTVSPIPQQAPVCSSDPLSDDCSLPSASMLSKSCIKKIPYTLLGISPGASFEVTDPGLVCKDEGLRGGVQQVSCTGQQLTSYEIKVCNSLCNAALETDGSQCAEGYGYDAAAGCCWPIPDLETGCILYKVDIGGCQ